MTKQLTLILLFLTIHFFSFSQTNSFNLHQEIFTNGANDSKYFTIDGENFLAVSEFQNNSSVELYSTIYKWNFDSMKFISFQEIFTLGASDWEYFEINDEHYLATANYRSDTSFTENSIIYKWNGSQFINFQEIETQGAYDWEFFEIDDTAFLAIANQDNGTTKNINSYIYKWNGLNFQYFQTIATKGATDWEAFIVNDEQYLAIANVYSLNSTIYKWNETQFVSFQMLNHIAITGIEKFEIADYVYLALSIGYGNVSKIYNWDGTEFTSFQDIDSKGAFDVEYFQMNNEHFLTLANYLDDTTYTTNSELLKWNGTEFVNFQSILTHAAVDFEYFEIQDSSYIMISEYKESSEHNIYSRIFKYLPDSIQEPIDTTQDTTSITVFQKEVSPFNVFPNPTSNVIIISVESCKYSIEIINIFGKKVYSNQSIKKENSIDLSELNISKGTYIVSIKTDTNYYTSKIIYK